MPAARRDARRNRLTLGPQGRCRVLRDRRACPRAPSVCSILTCSWSGSSGAGRKSHQRGDEAASRFEQQGLHLAAGKARRLPSRLADADVMGPQVVRGGFPGVGASMAGLLTSTCSLSPQERRRRPTIAKFPRRRGASTSRRGGSAAWKASPVSQGKKDPGVLGHFGDEGVDQRPAHGLRIDRGEMGVGQEVAHHLRRLAGIDEVVDDQHFCRGRYRSCAGCRRPHL